MSGTHGISGAYLARKNKQDVAALSDEQLRRLYPLSRLPTQSLFKLRESMRIINLRARHRLFSVGETPAEVYWLLDGVVQLSDANEERMEAVSGGGTDMSNALPRMVPSEEFGLCVVDCRVLCVDRQILGSVLEKLNIDPSFFHSLDENSANHEALLEEFQRLRERQVQSYPSSSIESEDTLDPFQGEPDGIVPLTKAAALNISNSSAFARRITPTSLNPQAPAAMREPMDGEASGYRYRVSSSIASEPVGSEELTKAFDAFEVLPGYQRLPLSLRAECLMECRIVRFEQNDQVFRQGDTANFWYMILEGECSVEFNDGNGRRFSLNRYAVGDSFGEDGLLTGRKRNAAIVVREPMVVLRMPKYFFRRLLLPVMVRGILAEQLSSKEYQTAQLVDVRLPKEYAQSKISGAIEIPWPIIRSHAFSSAHGRTFVIVSDDELDSLPIVYMMQKFGFNAVYLQGGFASVPGERIVSRQTRKARAAPGGIVRIV